MMRRMLVVLCTLLVLLTAVTDNARACQCVNIPTVDQARQHAAAVFTGEVVGIERDKGESYEKARFSVERMWKGSLEEEAVVFVHPDFLQCDLSFKVGQSYLVYAEGDKPFSTGYCTRTASLSDAGGDLTALGPGTNTSRVTEPTSSGFALDAQILALLLAGVLSAVTVVARRARRQPRTLDK